MGSGPCEQDRSLSLGAMKREEQRRASSSLVVLLRRKRHESVMKASREVAGNAGEWLTPPSLWPIQAQGRLHLTSIGQWLVLAQLQGPIHFPAQYLPHLLQARQR